MTAEELNTLKATFKEHLTEIGYTRWEKYLFKCMGSMPFYMHLIEPMKYGGELIQKEHILKIANG